MEDEGRPFEVGFQEQASNHLKRLLPKVMVVSIEVKVRVENSAGKDEKDE